MRIAFVRLRERGIFPVDGHVSDVARTLLCVLLRLRVLRQHVVAAFRGGLGCVGVTRYGIGSRRWVRIGRRRVYRVVIGRGRRDGGVSAVRNARIACFATGQNGAGDQSALAGTFSRPCNGCGLRTRTRHVHCRGAACAVHRHIAEGILRRAVDVGAFILVIDVVVMAIRLGVGVGRVRAVALVGVVFSLAVGRHVRARVELGVGLGKCRRADAECADDGDGSCGRDDLGRCGGSDLRRGIPFRAHRLLLLKRIDEHAAQTRCRGLCRGHLIA